MGTLKLLFLFLTLSFFGWSKDIKQDITCLTQTIYFEARGDTLEGRLAVGNVVMNRYRDWGFKSVCSVVSQKGQFGWWNIRNRKILEKRKWEEANAIAILLTYKLIGDNTGGSYFFHEEKIKPKWTKGLTKVGKIGDHHIFYTLNIK